MQGVRKSYFLPRGCELWNELRAAALDTSYVLSLICWDIKHIFIVSTIVHAHYIFGKNTAFVP